jgi:DNA-binding GntR family transcriptional regulator
VTARARPPRPGTQPDALLNDRAYAAIRDAITSLRLPPGRSVSVGELADWLKMSRTPVRDALQRLQHDGLIRSLPRRGLVVTQLTAKVASELYEMHEALEAMAARLAAGRASAGQKQRLVEVCRQLGKAAGDAAAWARADADYHAALLDAAGNATLARAAESLAPQLHRFRVLAAMNLPDRPARSAKEHLAVARAIADGDGDAAAARTHEHWAVVRAEVLDNIRRYLEPLGGVLAEGGGLALGPPPVTPR